MTVQVYTSEDAGAPPLNGEAGSLVSLLDAVLVDGYGDKDSLGWTIEFSGTDKRAYRQPIATSAGRYLRVQNDADGFPSYSALVMGYDTMTGVDIGSGAFYAFSRYWWGSASTNSSPRRWVVIGDDAGGSFWFFPLVYSDSDWSDLQNTGGTPFGFGDLYGFPWANNVVRSYLLASASASPGNNDLVAVPQFGAGYGLMYPAEPGDTSGVNTNLTYHGSVLNGSFIVGNVAANFEQSGIGVDDAITDGFVVCSGRKPVGMFPGLSLPLLNRPSNDHGLTVTINARSYWLQSVAYSVNSNGNAGRNGCWYIDISGPWQ